MYAFLIVVFLFVCLALTIVILLQSSKGGGLAGAFGGGGGDMGAVFGGRGAATFLTRITTGLAIAFLSVSLLLSLMSKGNSSGSQSLVEQAQQEVGSVPAANLPVVPTSGAQPGLLPVQTQEAGSDSTQ